MAISSRVYQGIIRNADKFVPAKLRPLWEHEAGPKTVFFWGPIVKWGLVAASLSDLRRPADQLSLKQSGSLALTGFIWSRYCLVIIPKNWLLFSVNFFVGLANSIQVYRVLDYERKHPQL